MNVMEVPMRAAVLMLFCAGLAVPVGAQTQTPDITIPPPPLKTVSLSGPRFGVTALSQGVVDKLHERSIDVSSTITQFGWQFEREFYNKGGGVAAMTTPLSPVDVLAIGPHPDDIEIGIGGLVAKHVALGHQVGLCDLTAGEMGSNGTVAERLAEADAACDVLGAAWRVNLRLPDRAIGRDAEQMRAVASLVRRAQPRVIAIPYWSDRHPDHEKRPRADRCVPPRDL